jgi:hypothetical protein
VRGVAEEGNRAPDPPRQWIPLEDRPPTRTRRSLDEAAQARIPRRELGCHVLHPALCAPGLHRPVRFGHVRNDIDQRAARDRVMHHVTARADPQGLHRATGEVGCRFRRHQATVGTEPGEHRLRRRNHGGSHGGMRAVGTDDHSGGGGRAVLESDEHVVGSLLDPDAALAQHQALRVDRGHQRREQICAVSHQAVLAVQPTALCSQLLGKQHRSIAPAAELPADLERNGVALQNIDHPQPADESHGVGRYDQPCTDGPQLGCLLVDTRPSTGPLEECGRGESADATTDHDDVRLGIRHLSCGQAILLERSVVGNVRLRRAQGSTLTIGARLQRLVRRANRATRQSSCAPLLTLRSTPWIRPCSVVHNPQ